MAWAGRHDPCLGLDPDVPARPGLADLDRGASRPAHRTRTNRDEDEAGSVGVEPVRSRRLVLWPQGATSASNLCHAVWLLLLLPARRFPVEPGWWRRRWSASLRRPA